MLQKEKPMFTGDFTFDHNVFKDLSAAKRKKRRKNSSNGGDNVTASQNGAGGRMSEIVESPSKQVNGINSVFGKYPSLSV